jgi:hypothetical protein
MLHQFRQGRENALSIPPRTRGMLHQLRQGRGNAPSFPPRTRVRLTGKQVNLKVFVQQEVGNALRNTQYSRTSISGTALRGTKPLEEGDVLCNLTRFTGRLCNGLKAIILYGEALRAFPPAHRHQTVHYIFSTARDCQVRP